MLPSCIKSKKDKFLPTYLLAIETTSLKFDSAKILLASSSPSSTLFDNASSSSKLSKLILPISLRYILTGSFMLAFLGKSTSSIDKTSPSSCPSSSLSKSSAIISMLFS